MSTTLAPTPFDTGGRPHPGFGALVRSEVVKLTSVRSTWWNLGALVLLGAGLTVLLSGLNAEWLASPEADESPGSFATWGMLIAPVTAVILGALTATSEYSTGQIRTTFAATPRRGAVLAAKTLVVAVPLFVIGTLTAFAGYFGANWFFEREGIGLALEGDVLRAMFGSGLWLAGVGVFSLAVGFVLRHTAGTISLVLALMFVVGGMMILVPGDVGLWLERLMPGNAGSVIAAPVAFNPDLLDPWPSFGVFVAEITALMVLALALMKRRDA